MVPGAKAPDGMALFVETLCEGPGGDRMLCTGAPCRDKENAFILAAMSDVSPLARVGGGPGRRAALICARGAEDGLMVLGKDPSLATRREGGLGGESESCKGCNVGGDLQAFAGWLSPSGVCDSDASGGGVVGMFPSIYTNIRQFREIAGEGERLKGYVKVIEWGSERRWAGEGILS
jgi:hypothetical protein